MLFTVTFSLPKEEVYAIAATLDPAMERVDAVGAATPLITEWIRTTINKKIREIMKDDLDDKRRTG